MLYEIDIAKKILFVAVLRWFKRILKCYEIMWYTLWKCNIYIKSVNIIAFEERLWEQVEQLSLRIEGKKIKNLHVW